MTDNLLDMPPVLSTYNVRNCSPGYSELPGEIASRHIPNCSFASDFQHLLGRQFRACIRLASPRAWCRDSFKLKIGMSLILGMSHILQIFNAVITWVAVLVVDFLPRRALSNECCGDQAMYQTERADVILTQAYHGIALSIKGWVQNLSRSSALAFLYAPDTSLIAYIIHVLKVRYGSPRFHWFLPQHKYELIIQGVS